MPPQIRTARIAVKEIDLMLKGGVLDDAGLASSEAQM